MVLAPSARMRTRLMLCSRRRRHVCLQGANSLWCRLCVAHSVRHLVRYRCLLCRVFPSLVRDSRICRWSCVALEGLPYCFYVAQNSWRLRSSLCPHCFYVRYKARSLMGNINSDILFFHSIMCCFPCTKRLQNGFVKSC